MSTSVTQAIAAAGAILTVDGSDNAGTWKMRLTRNGRSVATSRVACPVDAVSIIFALNADKRADLMAVLGTDDYEHVMLACVQQVAAESAPGAVWQEVPGTVYESPPAPPGDEVVGYDANGSPESELPLPNEPTPILPSVYPPAAEDPLWRENPNPEPPDEVA